MSLLSPALVRPAGLLAPGGHGRWPQFHPALPSRQAHLQGEKHTLDRVSPESFLERGLWGGLGLGFLTFGVGRHSGQLSRLSA